MRALPSEFNWAETGALYETEDYQAAVQRYYLSGARIDWQASHIIAYASMHPWEDFAETWAHYLHMITTLDTAHAYRLRTAPPATASVPRTSAMPSIHWRPRTSTS